MTALEAAKSETATDYADSTATEPVSKSVKGAKAAIVPQSAQLTECLSSPAIREWAKISPPVASIDLRPYLFLAKDKKDYFGAATVLGHFPSVAEKLLGSKLSVQALEPSLRKLAFAESAQVFELVRGRIIGGDTFDTEPAGAAGQLFSSRPKVRRPQRRYSDSISTGHTLRTQNWSRQAVNARSRSVADVAITDRANQ